MQNSAIKKGTDGGIIVFEIKIDLIRDLMEMK